MKKNIVIVVSAMNMGGAQRVVSILSDHWAKNEYDVTLISTYTGEKTSHFKVNDDVNLIYLNNSPYFSRSKICNLIWKLFCLRKEIKKINPEAVISFLTRVNIAAALSAVGIKSSLIICERAWPPFATLNRNFYWMYRIFLKRVDKIVVQTERSKVWLKNNFPDMNAHIIPNPIDFPLPLHKERFVTPSTVISQRRKVILASGRMHRFKQFDLLIRAFSQIKDKHKDWDLIILGDGEEKDALIKLLFDLDIKDRVYFPGRVGNISEWYERADLFVLSSKVEGFPNVLLEAMAYGLPCVSFDCNTGPAEMIENGVNGILVNPIKKELGLIHALDEMINDEEKRNSIANNALFIKDKYSIPNIMKKWDKVLGL